MQSYTKLSQQELDRMGNVPGNVLEAQRKGRALRDSGKRPAYYYTRDEVGGVEITVTDTDAVIAALKAEIARRLA